MTLIDSAHEYWKNWQVKQLTRRKLNRLVEQIALIGWEAQSSDGVRHAVLDQDLKRVERKYRKALEAYGEDDIEECKKQADRGLIYARIASLHRQMNDAPTERMAFPEDSVESLILLLSVSIARIKIAVESTNCRISDVAASRLARVVAQFNESLELLKENDAQGANRCVQSGLMSLYVVARQLQHDNNEITIVDLRTEIKKLPRELKQYKELIDRVFEVKRKFSSDEDECSVELVEIESEIERGLKAFAEEDLIVSRNLVEKALVRMQLVEKLESKGNAQSKDGEDGSNVVEELEQRHFRASIRELQRLVDGRSSRAAQALEKLDESIKFHEAACRARREGQLKEAQRLARSAHLELDFARQLLLTKGTPGYSDL